MESEKKGKLTTQPSVTDKPQAQPVEPFDAGGEITWTLQGHVQQMADEYLAWHEKLEAWSDGYLRLPNREME